MSYVQTKTDSSRYSSVDSVDAGVTLEVTKQGFGYFDNKGVFVVLDAMPLGRAEIQAAVEAGSAALAATPGGIAAGFTAVDFSVNVDYVDETEVDANVSVDSDSIVSALV